ncbi:hypothetical protein DLP3_005 [Stenotrophomonas phage vB_SmaS_DLP_3]|nr:hypothetical protein DLP3_005 [Stenotrophomonas phage vB_SmaS_DLP_3]
MQAKISMNKMGDADVNFVSLVGRAANRIPFRITKSDKENKMGLDLSGIGRALKGKKVEKAEVKPELVAVVVEKSDLLPQITDAVSAAGLAVDNVVEDAETGTVAFVQKESEEGEDLTTIKMDGNVSVVVKGFSAYCDHLKDFNEIVQAQGFYAGMDVATSALRDSVYKGLYNSDNPQEAVAKAETVLSQFTTYMKTLVGNLPANAFYVSKGVAVVVEKAAKDKTDAEAAKEKAKETPADKSKGADKTNDAKAKKDGEEEEINLDEVPEDVSKKDWTAKSEDERRQYHAAKKAAAEPAQKSETPAPAVDVADIVQKTADAVLKALAPTLESIQKSQKETEEKVDSVVQKSETVAKQLGSTVVNTSEHTDAPSGNVQKSAPKDTDPRSGCFDTALIRKSAQRRSISG